MTAPASLFKLLRSAGTGRACEATDGTTPQQQTPLHAMLRLSLLVLAMMAAVAMCYPAEDGPQPEEAQETLGTAESAWGGRGWGGGWGGRGWGGGWGGRGWGGGWGGRGWGGGYGGHGGWGGGGWGGRGWHYG